jgi:hypothetical protein
VNADLADMLKVSHDVGRDPRLVQGGGGNTSVKTDGGARMYVKASGTALGDMEEGRGYRLVDVAQCVGILEDEEIKALEEEMERLAEELRFEEAAELRDRILELKGEALPQRGIGGLRRKKRSPRGVPAKAERGMEAPAPYGRRRHPGINRPE